MNRIEFMNSLQYKLRRLPYEEVQNAISYYEEYFDEAGTENEAQTIVSLGSPSDVASKIIGEYAITVAEFKPVEKKKTNVILVTVLAIFASPIALPIAISILLILFSVGLVIFSLFITGVASIIAGIATLFMGFWAFSDGFGTGLFYIGSSVLIIAIGASITLGTLKLGKITLLGLQRWMGKLLIRRSK